MDKEWMRQLGELFNFALETLSGADDCCRVNCGPCRALDWYRQHADIFADECMALIAPGGDADWQQPDGTINWEWVEGKWAAHLGCSYGPFPKEWSCDLPEKDEPVAVAKEEESHAAD